MNNLIDSILVMKMDVYMQTEEQDSNTGALKKQWSYIKTIPCHAKGIISNSATSRSGDKQIISNRYVNDQSLEIRTETKINYREKITNIRDANDNVIWTELDYPSDTPTVFEVSSSTPITDPFGNVLGFNSVAKRSENQTIGL